MPRHDRRDAGGLVVDAPPRGRMVLGMHPVRELVRRHGKSVIEVLIEGRDGDVPRLDALARFADGAGARAIRRVPRRELDAVARGVVHQGVAAWGPELALVPGAELLEDPALLAVALDRIQDTQNFGAIVRSAVALAGAAVVWPESSSAPLTPATFRASAGAIEHARLCRVSSLPAWLSDAATRGMSVVGLDSSADLLLSDVNLSRPAVLVIGAEHRGLGRAVRAACTSLCRIPQAGPVASLNASAAAAVSLYAAAIYKQ